MVGWGVGTTVFVVRAWVTVIARGYSRDSDGSVRAEFVTPVLLGSVLLFLAVEGLAGIVRLERGIADR